MPEVIWVNERFELPLSGRAQRHGIPSRARGFLHHLHKKSFLGSEELGVQPGCLTDRPESVKVHMRREIGLARIRKDITNNLVMAIGTERPVDSLWKKHRVCIEAIIECHQPALLQTA